MRRYVSSGLGGLLEIVGLEVMVEGVRTATLLKSWSSSIYLHWGPGHPPAERGPSLESIFTGFPLQLFFAKVIR